MSRRKPKLTDDEIEAQVLADLDDPSAWDDPIYVPPSKSPLQRAHNIPMPSRFFAVLRSLVFAPAFVALWLYFVPVWLGGAHVFEGPRPYGWILVGIGMAIDAACVAMFAWRGLGTPFPLDPPRRLVITGPYRWVRNPMYVGFGIAMIGMALVFPNLTRFMLIEMVVGVAAVSLLTIAYEEPKLRALFGADYDEYCRHVGRWIPRLTPWYAPTHLD